MGKLIPVILALIGIGAGVGAGIALKPEPTEDMHAETTHDCPETSKPSMSETDDHKDDAEDADTSREYVKLNNQFVVPVVTDDLVDALVVMSLSIEIEDGQAEVIYTKEPKLRDAFLQVMFDHANIGGFRGEFTNSNNMDVLRAALTQTARTVVGDIVSSILITDIARQDV